MKLKSLATVNWSNIPDDNYQFTDRNYFIGDSGAGKTTILDALQTILSGNMRGLYSYNPTQDEALQHSLKRETRNLASYALGCDQGKYDRQETHTYVAANFQPEMGEQSVPFTALMAISARVNEVTSGSGIEKKAVQDQLKFYIIEGRHLSTNDFYQANVHGDLTVVSLDDLKAHMATLPENAFNLPSALDKTEYVCTLYGCFRNQQSLSVSDAKGAAKSLTKFMAYKPLGGVDQFIRTEILEEKNDVKDVIKNIRETLSAVSRIREQAELYQNGANILKKMKGRADSCVEYLKQSRINDVLLAHYEAERFSTLIAKGNEYINSLQKQIDEDAINQTRVIELLNQNEQKRNLIEAQINKHEVLIKQQQYESAIEEAQKSFNNSLNELSQTYNTLRENKSLVNHVSAILPFLSDFLPFKQGLRDHISRLVDDLHEKFSLRFLQTQSVNEIDFFADFQIYADRAISTYASLSDYFESIRESITGLKFNSQENNKKIKQEISDLKIEIENLELRQSFTYPQHTELALKLIEEHFPSSMPSLVCQHIEVTDRNWQPAIEAFIGNDRFGIIVQSAFEDKAQQLLRDHKLFRAFVVQSARIEKDYENKFKGPISNSIIEHLEFENPIAKRFIALRFANVKQVENAQDLRAIPRGLMKDGRNASGYKRGVVQLSDDNMFFGENARLQQLESKKKKLQEKKKELDEEEDRFTELEIIYKACIGVKPIENINVVHHITASISKIRDNETLLKQLDTADSQHLLDKRKKLKEEQLELDQQKTDLAAEIRINSGKSKSAKQNNDNFIKNSELAGYALEDALTRLSEFTEIMEMDTPSELISDFLDKLQLHAYEIAKLVALTIEEADETYVTNTTLKGNLISKFSDLSQAIEEFNLLGIAQTSIDDTLKRDHRHWADIHKNKNDGNDYFDDIQSSHIRELSYLVKRITSHYENFEQNILLQKRKELGDLENEFKKAFISDLCITVARHIEEADMTLRLLNQKLTKQVFGNDFFKFHWNDHPEYSKYAKFFKNMSALSEEILGVENMDAAIKEHDETLFDIYESIKEQLLTDDIEISMKLMVRWTDYRNFRRYDIRKFQKDDDSGHFISLERDATGSGGQLETPSYVIRATSLMTALGSDLNRDALRLIMIDEAFHKSDEIRVRNIIEYLSDRLGFQLFVVMPTRSSQPLLACFHRLFTITKQKRGAYSVDSGSELDTEVLVTIKDLKPERISELWTTTQNQVTEQAELEFLQHVGT